MLVALIFLSLVQDVFWFLLNRDVEDDDDDGGTEKKIKIFSRIMSFISMGWRVSISAVGGDSFSIIHHSLCFY